MARPHRRQIQLWALLLAALPLAARASDPQQELRLLESRRCNGCRLEEAELVQTDLHQAQLRGAHLQRANLSGARLDGADLRGADLRFTSLHGASLQGADLRGAVLSGADLRQADLSEAQLDPGAIANSHWQGARGIDPSQHSYATLHNAGVSAAQQGRYPEAERLFGEAIRRQPEAAISWVARGICRAEQGNTTAAAQDLTQASELYQASGDALQAKQLSEAANRLTQPPKSSKSGNGLATNLASGAMQMLQILAPIAIKAFAASAL